MKYSAKFCKPVYLAVLLCLLAWLPAGIAHSQSLPDMDCEGDSRISEVFDNGARWDLCWESRVRENLVLSDVHYTPPGGEPYRVLSSARLSQLHVAYDDSDVTYNDITQYGLGGGYLLSLSEADCPKGTLLRVQTRPALCRWRSQKNSGYRTASRSLSTQSLNLFSMSQVGAYAYIINWTFYADGAIEPGIGATGALQRSSDKTELPYGRVLQGDPDSLWLSHTHNYYWRLDFDLGVSANDDTVSETRFRLAPDGTRELQNELFIAEQARRIDPDSQQAWIVTDAGKAAGNTPENADPGYLIEPIRTGHRFKREEVEPYTDYDFFVTVANDCERFASQNARFNPDCKNHVLQYVDGQSLLGQDIVAWYRVAFHHVPRSEDQRHMHTHWDGFVLQPVNLQDSTIGLARQANEPPLLPQLTARTSQLGEHAHASVVATDRDADVLTYRASGLPPGISMGIRGQFYGEPMQTGSYTVTLAVSDDHTTATGEFQWLVSDQQSTDGNARKTKSGRITLLMYILIIFGVVRSRSRQRQSLPGRSSSR